MEFITNTVLSDAANWIKFMFCNIANCGSCSVNLFNFLLNFWITACVQMVKLAFSDYNLRNFQNNCFNPRTRTFWIVRMRFIEKVYVLQCNENIEYRLTNIYATIFSFYKFWSIGVIHISVKYIELYYSSACQQK